MRTLVSVLQQKLVVPLVVVSLVLKQIYFFARLLNKRNLQNDVHDTEPMA